ncbi:MAG TPA: hypothetical protein V6D05_08340 [Stenomitos sp.]
MRRFTIPVLVALSVPALAGCPTSPMATIGDPMMPYPNQRPMPYATPMPLPMMTSAPAYPVTGYPVPTLVGDGSSMDDAYHYVQRYAATHYPGAEIVAIRSAQVTLSGRIAKAGSWSFTYRAPVAATASASTQAVDIPSQFESRQLTFTLNGNNDLFAPEVMEKVVLQPFDYTRVLPLGKALEICQSFGMAVGPGGVSVALVSDTLDGTYYEVDNSIGYQGGSTTSYGPGSIGGYAPPSYVRLKYRIDAMTGNLLARLTP